MGAGGATSDVLRKHAPQSYSIVLGIQLGCMPIMMLAASSRNQSSMAHLLSFPIAPPAVEGPAVELHGCSTRLKSRSGKFLSSTPQARPPSAATASKTSSVDHTSPHRLQQQQRAWPGIFNVPTTFIITQDCPPQRPACKTAERVQQHWCFHHLHAQGATTPHGCFQAYAWLTDSGT